MNMKDDKLRGSATVWCEASGRMTHQGKWPGQRKQITLTQAIRPLLLSTLHRYHIRGSESQTEPTRGMLLHSWVQ